jgi:RimJ/RimL family protein N-acetyltransferase
MGMPLIRTSRLLLRGWRDDDRDGFAAMNRDPRVMEFFVRPLTLQESNAFLDRIRDCWTHSRYGLWAVERSDLGCFIGYVGLWPATFEARFTPAVEVGWRLAASHWGHGFATEAARQALRFGFDMVGLEEIVSFTAAGNLRSRRVMQRLGMQWDPADDFDHPWVPNGHRLQPHVLYRLSRLGLDDVTGESR